MVKLNFNDTEISEMHEAKSCVLNQNNELRDARSADVESGNFEPRLDLVSQVPFKN